MKKTLKALVLAVIIGLVLISLTGCGGNKLVATKTTEDEMMGNYKEKIVITFKKDKVEAMEMTMEYDKEETAQAMYGILSFGMSMAEDGELDGMDFKQDGKKIIINMDASAYEATRGTIGEMTKEELKTSLEKEGYKVK